MHNTLQHIFTNLCKIYVVGGFNGSYLNSLEEYNPSTNTWSTKASMPYAKSYFGTAVVNNCVVVVAGSLGNNNRSNTIEEYNPSSNTWQMRGSIVNAVDSPGCAVLNGYIYVIGGFASYKGNLKSVEVINPSANYAVSAKANMPTARSSLTSSTVNGKIYNIGGFDIDILSTVEAFSIT